MAKDNDHDHKPADFFNGQPPPARERIGPMRRTDRPSAPEVSQALDAVILESHARTLEDHEQRLRKVEAFMWKLLGAAVAGGGLGAGLTKLLGG